MSKVVTLSIMLLIYFSASIMACVYHEYGKNDNVSMDDIPHIDESIYFGCLPSGGTWNDRLESCICPEGKAFIGGTCQYVKMNRTLQKCVMEFNTHKDLSKIDIKDCFSVIYDNVGFDVSNVEELCNEEIEIILNALERDHAYLVKGYSFAGSNGNTKIFGSLSLINRQEFNDIYRLDFLNGGDTGGKTRAFIGNIRNRYHPYNIYDPTTQKKWIIACTEYLEGIFDSAVSGFYCNNIVKATEVIFKNKNRLSNFGNIKYKFLEEGNSCLPGCYKQYHIEANNRRHRIVAQIKFREHIPFKRQIRITNNQNEEVILYLSPEGYIDEIVAAKVIVDTKNTLIVKRKIIGYDGHWNKILDLKEDSCERKALVNSINNHYSPTKRGNLFPFEEAYYDQKGHINILMIDSSFNINNPVFFGRLLVEERKDDNVENILGNLIKGTHSFINKILGLMGEYKYALDTVSHAEEMASIILTNLPDAKLSLIYNKSLEDSTASDWIDAIKNSKSEIVNISQSFNMTIFDCDNFFSDVFEALPDVLFVVAAGNTGALNPDTCPARIGSLDRFSNVLTVAGHNEFGSIDRASSYGNRAAKIAMPYNNKCMKSEFQNNIWSHSTETCGGTSVATAITSNFAAKLKLRNPHLSAVEIATIFKKNCLSYGWPVQCGGPVNLTAINSIG